MRKVKLLKGFVPGRYEDVYAFLSSYAEDSYYLNGNAVKIANNTSIRLCLINGLECITYRHYSTDILKLYADGIVTIPYIPNLSATTKSRLNQFLAPFNRYIYTSNFDNHIVGEKKIKETYKLSEKYSFQA